MIKNLNYILILLTIFILVAIGVIFIYGSTYSWVQSIQSANWRQTVTYQNYVNDMNVAVLPLSVALVILLGLCVPKRIFSGVALLQSMAALLVVSVLVVLVYGLKPGIGFLLITAVLIQAVGVGMTLAGSKRLSYEVNGFYLQIGSAVLHLGFILFVFDFVLLGESTLHLTVYWVSTVLISVGMILSFYSGEISRLAEERASRR